MKEHFLLIAIIFVSLVSACSKKADDVSPDDPQGNAKAGFYCKVDGKDFAPDFAYATSVFTDSYGIYGLYSTNDNVIYLQIPANVGKGTHKIDNTAIKAFMNLGKTTELEFSTIHGGTGTLVITEKDSKGLKGTFYFTILNSKGTQSTVSVGQFNVLFK